MTQGSGLRMIGFEEIAAIVAAHRRFVVTTHVNPDGDAIGSQVALGQVLRQRGKEVRMLNASATPANLSFLNEDGAIAQYREEEHRAIVEDAEVIFIVDLNSAQRLQSMTEAVLASRAVKIVIDHHLNPESFADGYCLRQTACATAEVLFDFIDATMPGEFTPAVALGLYTGIMTDTGSFRFPNTSARTHALAARCLDRGVDPADVALHIFDEFPIGRAMLLGRILATMESFCDDKATIMVISREDLRETHAGIEETEGLVNYGLSFRGAMATALLTELEDGSVKISFRGRSLVGIVDTARRFGGGGHRLAAGATVTGKTIAQVRDMVKEALTMAVNASG